MTPRPTSRVITSISWWWVSPHPPPVDSHDCWHTPARGYCCINRRLCIIFLLGWYRVCIMFHLRTRQLIWLKRYALALSHRQKRFHILKHHPLIIHPHPCSSHNIPSLIRSFDSSRVRSNGYGPTMLWHANWPKMPAISVSKSTLLTSTPTLVSSSCSYLISPLFSFCMICCPRKKLSTFGGLLLLCCSCPASGGWRGEGQQQRDSFVQRQLSKGQSDSFARECYSCFEPISFIVVTGAWSREWGWAGWSFPFDGPGRRTCSRVRGRDMHFSVYCTAVYIHHQVASLRAILGEVTAVGFLSL